MARDHNTIIIRGGAGQFEEKPAATAIAAGHLIVPNSAGKFIKNVTAGVVNPICVAREDSYQGKTIEGSYAINDVVFGYWPKKGECVNLRVSPGAPAILIGDPLVATIVGTVEKGGTLLTANLVAEEPLDQSAQALDGFLKVRVV